MAVRQKTADKPATSRAKAATPAAVSSAVPRTLALVAIFAVSAAGLVFEITLTRLFSLFFQYHFTFLAVSLAILGLSLGAASAFYLKPERIQSVHTLIAVLVALSLSLSAAAAIIAWLPSAESIFPRAFVALVPFFLIGLFAALTFENFSGSGGTFYAADLIGAALGVVAVLALLYLLSAFSVVLLLAALIGLVALLFQWRSNSRPLAGLISVVLAVALLVSGVVDFNPLTLTGASRDKTMIYILQDQSQLGRVAYTGWSPFSRVDVVETGDHSAKYVFADGGAGAYMMSWNGDPASIASFPMTRTMDAIPFASGSAGHTLVVGAGGGKDILLALNAGATAITAVEVNPTIISVTRQFADYNGSVLDLPEVELVEGDARSFAERTDEQYDLIYMSLVYTQAVEPASQTLVENYVFTTEAFETFLNRLAPGGRLSIVAHNGVEGSRAMLTALQALENMGVPPAQALDHLWLWKASSDDQTQATSVLVVGKDPLPANALQQLDRAAQRQGMQPLFSPGEYEQLFQPLRDGGSLETYIESDAAYNLAPTSDDQPYFFNVDHGIPPAIRSTLVLAALLALGLVILGVITHDSAKRDESPSDRAWWATLGYAALIGVGFMLVEVPLIQRFGLLLGQPILSLAAVLATLLLAGGLGSWVSQRWGAANLPSRVRFVGVWVVVLALVYWVALPPLVESLLGESFAVRLLAIIVLTALLGFPMGIPFPSLMRLAAQGRNGERQQVALLWAINGAFSVLGSTLAVVISMQWGFGLAMLIGAAFYGLLVLVTLFLKPRLAGQAEALPKVMS